MGGRDEDAATRCGYCVNFVRSAVVAPPSQIRKGLQEFKINSAKI